MSTSHSLLQQGQALQTICTSVSAACSGGHGDCRWVFLIEMPNKIRIELIERMADVEYRLAYGTSEKLQLGALVGAFSQAAEGLIAAAK